MKPLIFLVEDNPADVLFLKSAFVDAELECDFEIAEDGDKALSMLFDERESTPNLILLDINLPKVSGKEILRKLKKDERYSAVPTFMLSGSSAERDIEESLEGEADGYIVKPSTLGEYSRAVQMLEEVLHDTVYPDDVPEKEAEGNIVTIKKTDKVVEISLTVESITHRNVKECDSIADDFFGAITDKDLELLESVIMDLSGLKLLDSKGFHFILGVYKHSKKQKLGFEMKNIEEPLMRKLSVFNLLGAQVDKAD